MKKFITLALAAVLTLSMAAASMAAPLEDAQVLEVTAYKSTPTIDGVVTEEEWGAPVQVITLDNMLDYATVCNGTEEDLTNPEMVGEKTSVYFRWDDEHLFHAIVIENTSHWNSVLPGNDGGVWVGTSFNWSTKSAREADGRTKHLIGLNNDGDLLAFIEAVEDGVAAYTGICADQGEDSTIADGFQIKRDGKNTTYEVAFRWDKVIPDAVAYSEGDEICFLSFYMPAMSDDVQNPVDSDLAGWTDEGASKWFGVTLGGEPVVETEPVVEETVAETVAPSTDAPAVVAPQTFDAGIIAAVAAVVSAAGYAISKKR